MRLPSVVVLLGLLSAVPLKAAPIPLTGSWVTAGGGELVILNGPDVHAELQGSDVEDFTCHPCLPGEHLLAHFVAGDLGGLGTLIYQGATYPTGPGAGHALFGIFGDVTFTLPFPIAPTTTIQAPFTLGGLMILPTGERFALAGQGTVTWDWHREPNPLFGDPNVFPFIAAQEYQWTPDRTINFALTDATQVPEPTSLLLLGTGFCALRKRRR